MNPLVTEAGTERRAVVLAVTVLISVVAGHQMAALEQVERGRELQAEISFLRAGLKDVWGADHAQANGPTGMGDGASDDVHPMASPGLPSCPEVAARGIMTPATPAATQRGDPSREALARLEERVEHCRSLLTAIPTTWPAEGSASSGFGYRQDPFTGQGAVHRGLDIAAPRGAPVLAPAGGVVAHAGFKGSYGRLVILEHGHGLETRFAHLSKILVHPGEVLMRGDQIGRIGSTGRSTGPHLHYEVRLESEAVDPEMFIFEVGAELEALNQLSLSSAGQPLP